MAFDLETAAIRFGLGLSPHLAPPASVAAMLDLLRGPDVMARRFAIGSFQELDASILLTRRYRKVARKYGETTRGKAAETKVRQLIQEARATQLKALRANLARSVATTDGLRERLSRFWGDHFTVVGKSGVYRAAASSFVEDAIRPHLTGRFADLLIAATLHPMMLLYLDQVTSAGEGSLAARRAGFGLNENLAREVLELHTLGVDGAYGQKDVRGLANMLAGATYKPGRGSYFSKALGEPGEKTVLGRAYGEGWARLEDLKALLEDLAMHPDTAWHLARKLVVHFIADQPDEALVAHVAAAYQASGGQLMATYAALLEHPASWSKQDRKAKPPFDFVTSSLRALDVDVSRFRNMSKNQTRLFLTTPMALMGQAWERPDGPDGWPEAAEDWITPQGLAGRIQWAMTVPQRLQPDLPDPRDLVESALGWRVRARLRFAAMNAETRWEGIGLILVSPEFQRR